MFAKISIFETSFDTRVKNVLSNITINEGRARPIPRVLSRYRRTPLILNRSLRIFRISDHLLRHRRGKFPHDFRLLLSPRGGSAFWTIESMAYSLIGKPDSDTLGAFECYWSRCSHHSLNSWDQPHMYRSTFLSTGVTFPEYSIGSSVSRVV